MEHLILVSVWEGIVSKEELKELAHDIQSELEIEVHFYAPKHLLPGIPFWDVLELWIGAEVVKAATKSIVEHVVKNFIKWAGKRLKKEEIPRGKSITIYGPDGEILNSTEMNEKGEVEDKTKMEKNSSEPPTKSEPFF